MSRRSTTFLEALWDRDDRRDRGSARGGRKPAKASAGPKRTRPGEPVGRRQIALPPDVLILGGVLILVIGAGLGYLIGHSTRAPELEKTSDSSIAPRILYAVRAWTSNPWSEGADGRQRELLRDEADDYVKLLHSKGFSDVRVRPYRRESTFVILVGKLEERRDAERLVQEVRSVVDVGMKAFPDATIQRIRER